MSLSRSVSSSCSCRSEGFCLRAVSLLRSLPSPHAGDSQKSLNFQDDGELREPYCVCIEVSSHTFLFGVKQCLFRYFLISRQAPSSSCTVWEPLRFCAPPSLLSCVCYGENKRLTCLMPFLYYFNNKSYWSNYLLPWDSRTSLIRLVK